MTAARRTEQPRRVWVIIFILFPFRLFDPIDHFGVTMFYATSGLKNTEFQVVNTTVFSKEITKIKTIIEKVDHTAFVTIHPVSEVRGRGFTLEKQIEYDSILK